MPSFMPRNSNPNWNTPIATPYATIGASGIRGGRTKNTSGTAAKKKRSAASANGGISRSPSLIGTNEKPHSATTRRMSAKSRGVGCAVTLRA
jgi:hypothetical protein